MPFSLALVQRLARLAGGLAVLAVIVLSVVPGEMRPHTGFPGIAEHFAVYLGASALLALGYEKRVSAGVVAFAFSLAAAIFEIAQYFIPHRDANLLDVFASAGGAIVGAGLARLFMFLWRRYLQRVPLK
jgi:VanZ family protein